MTNTHAPINAQQSTLEELQIPQNLRNLYNKLSTLLPDQEQKALLAELAAPLRGALRVNSLKRTSGENIAQKLTERYGWDLSPIHYCDQGYWMDRENENAPGQTWEHRLGRFYIQDASSMLPVELFDFSQTESPLILDMAASPGGKTTHLINNTRDKGLVIANDASQDRIQALRIVLQNWGGIRQAITQFQGERFGQWFPNTFDAILLDAPCSMQNLRPTEARPMRPISEREEENLAKRQCKLLESALFAARPGGQIVYATCTLSPEEDELVLDWLLTKYPDAVRIENLSENKKLAAPGITGYQGQDLHPSLRNAFRLWPHKLSSSGFFCARLTKMNEVHGKTRPMPAFDIEKTGFSPVAESTRQKVIDLFLTIGIDLEKDFLQQNLSLWQQKEVIYLFPDRYFQQIGFLPLRSLGIPIAQLKADEIAPDNFFIARCFYQFDLPATVIEPELAAQWQAGSAIPAFSAASSRIQLLQTTEGEFLGIGTNNNAEFKNTLPRRMIL